MSEINYYFDLTDPLQPYTHCLAANTGSLPPANATRLAPEIAVGFWPCWNDKSWHLVEDHRLDKVYDLVTGAKSKIDALGPLPKTLTNIPRPGSAYRWGGEGWTYDPSLDPPSSDHDWDESTAQWIKKRFSKKDFLLLCGIMRVAALNAAISAGNALAKTVHDLLFASEYIDVTDENTGQLVQILTTTEAGSVLTEAQAAEILKGVPYDGSQS